MRATRRNPDHGNGGRNLDTLDSQILEILQRDGRASYREIGRRLGVSEGTVRSRSNRMQRDGVVTFAAIADPLKMGYRVMAFFLLKVQIGHQQSAIDALAEWPEVTYISSCIGRADLYVQVVCVDHDQLWTLLAERFPEVEGVEYVETFQELKMHKVSYIYPVTGMSSDATGPRGD